VKTKYTVLTNPWKIIEIDSNCRTATNL